MAKKTAAAFKVGDIATFVNYDPKALADGQQPILTPGSPVELLEAGTEPGSFLVVQTDDETKKDTVFIEEMAPASAETAAPVAPVAKPASAKPVAKAAAAKPAAAKPVGKAVTAKPAAPAAKAAAAKPAAAKPVAAKPAAAKPAAPAAKPAKAAKPAAAKAAAPAAPAEAAPRVRTRGKPAKAAKKEKKIKVAKAKPEDEEIIDTAAVTEVMSGDTHATTAAFNLVQTIESSYYTLGGVLAHIQKEKSYMAMLDGNDNVVYQGAKGFENYVQEELGLHPRKARYLIDIYRSFSKLGIDETRLTEVGWSKAKELARVATAANFEKLLKYAQEHTLEDVTGYAREQLVKAGAKKSGKEEGASGRNATSPTANKAEFKFRVFDDNADVVKQALESAGARLGTEDPNQRFVLILTEWLSIQEGAEVPAEAALLAFNARYGTDFAFAEEAAAEAIAA